MRFNGLLNWEVVYYFVNNNNGAECQCEEIYDNLYVFMEDS